MSKFIIKPDTAKLLTSLLIDDCDTVTNYISLVDPLCFTIADLELWTSYSSFFDDVIDLFAFHDNLHKEVMDYIINWSDKLRDICESLNYNDIDDTKIYNADFWEELSKVSELIYDNLKGIDIQKVG